MALAALVLFAYLADWLAGFAAVMLFIVLLPVQIGFVFGIAALIFQRGPPLKSITLTFGKQVPVAEIIMIILYLLELVAATTAFWILLGWLALQIILLLGFMAMVLRRQRPATMG